MSLFLSKNQTKSIVNHTFHTFQCNGKFCHIPLRVRCNFAINVISGIGVARMLGSFKFSPLTAYK